MTKPRLNLLPLEDRCTPASFAGNVITLDDAGEVLTISTSEPGVYTLTSTVDVNNEGTTATFTPTGPVSIADSANSTSVLFADSTAAYAHDFTVELNDGSQGVRFNGASAFDLHFLTVKVDRNIAVNPSAVVSITTGYIDFSANMQTNARIGEFIGVDVQGQINSTNYGGISVQGRGGLLNNTFGLIGVQVLGEVAKISSLIGGISVVGTGGGGSGDASIGVHVAGGAKVVSDGGLLNVTGSGGAGAGQGNYGVLVQNANSEISSTTGDVVVEGTAGTGGTKSYGVGVYVTDGGSISTSNSQQGVVKVTGTGGGSNSSAHNSGVFVVGSGSKIYSERWTIIAGIGGGGSSGGSTGVSVAEGGVLSSGSAGTSVTGTGGNGTGGNYNVGVMVQGAGSAISSKNSGVGVIGFAGAHGLGYNIGVMVFNAGKIGTEGTGTVGVTGTGKGPNNGRNYGVFVLERDAAITSTGAISVEGIAPTSGNMGTEAVFVSNEGSITSTSSVTVTADALSIDSQGGSISAGTGMVTIQPRTAGLRTRLGGGFDNVSSQPTLNLIGSELARISAGTLVIGNNTAGEIRVTNPVTGIQNVSNVQLISGGDIVSERNTRFDVGTAQLTLDAAGFIRPPTSNTGYEAFAAQTTTLATGSKVELPINGQLPDQYGHLDVTDALNLNNATLTFSGNFIPVKASLFTLVSATNITGTFANLPDSTVVIFNSVSMRINYTATSVTATVV